MDSLLEHAHWYHSLGFSVMPIHGYSNGCCTCGDQQCNKPGKHPAVSSWTRYQNTRADADTLEIWFNGRFQNHNIGLVTGTVSNNYHVVDIDTDEGKVGRETWFDLILLHGDFGPTLRWKTGGGGEHIIFRHPDGKQVKSQNSLYGENLDSKGEGGYVVVPPSNTNKGAYAFLERFNPINTPEWLLTLATQQVEIDHGPISLNGIQQTSLNRWGEITDGRDGYAVHLIIGTIKTWIEERGALPALEDLITEAWPTFEHKVVARGMTLDADGRGLPWFSKKCQYQLKQASLGKIRAIQDVEPGSVLPASVRRESDAGIGGEGEKVGASPSLNFQINEWGLERYEGDPPVARWLVENKIGLGIPILFAAQGGLGKSFLCLDLALKIAGGDQGMHQEFAFGGGVIENGTAVIFSAEDGQDSIHRRIQSFNAQTVLDRAKGKLFVVPMPDNGGTRPLVVEDRNRYVKTPFFADLIKQLKDFDNLRLLVLDPLQTFCHTDITSQPAAAQYFISCIGEICGETNASVILPHHMRKEGSFGIQNLMQAREAIRGTTALVDSVRCVLGIYQLPEQDELMVSHRLGFQPGIGNAVAGGVLKSNDFVDYSPYYAVRAENGLLMDRTMEVREILEGDNNLDGIAIQKIFQEIQKRWNSGYPFSCAVNTARSFQTYLHEDHAIPIKSARQYLNTWLQAGKLQNTSVDSNSKQMGLKVLEPPTRY